MNRLRRSLLIGAASYACLWALTATAGVRSGRARAERLYEAATGASVGTCQSRESPTGPGQPLPCFAMAYAPAPLMLRLRYGAIGIEEGWQTLELDLWFMGPVWPLSVRRVKY
jgi:hypothetical protein